VPRSRGGHRTTGVAETPLRGYAGKRDFASTPEPRPGIGAQGEAGPIFVVQKHLAARARLHWDVRLEHDGVLWSWAVPKGPSLDPADRRMAIHVEDHPIEYASFSGEIPQGQYGAGSVEIWDRGHWTPLADPVFGMGKGHLHFALHGERLSGAFSLVRMKQRGRQDSWLLIKDDDAGARKGGDAAALEARRPAAATSLPGHAGSPASGARKASLPRRQAPQLCAASAAPPRGEDWVCEIKLDGYRLLVRIDGSDVRLFTRNGHDWSDRMPRLARAFAELGVDRAWLDGEVVVLGPQGVLSFARLQAALSDRRDHELIYQAFDLMHLGEWDLRACSLLDRKALLCGIPGWDGMLRTNDHRLGAGQPFLAAAAAAGLEGIVMKRGDSPYRAGRGHGWVKVKCLGRAEFVVLGWTPPAGRRLGIGALHVGYHDAAGDWSYAGGVGTGFDDATLVSLRQRLDGLEGPRRAALHVDGEPVDPKVRWVRPDLVAEVRFTGWSAAGRLRHAVFLGLREDKPPSAVRREAAATLSPTAPPPAPPAPHGARVVVAHAPKPARIDIAGVPLSHASRPLWPGITKQDLAEYWQAIAAFALPGIAGRPLAILRCPDGVAGEQFFQKNRGSFLPPSVRDGVAVKQPYLAIDDVAGLVALTQMSTIELHSWGASEADPAHPDRLVFDLDPGEGVPWPEVVRAARDVRAHLSRMRLAAFCRTSGGKGLHVVVPLRPSGDWPAAKQFCRGFAERLAAHEPDRFVAHTRIADRRGRILIDWLRNGAGATAIASLSPRARPGATVATPLAWREVTNALDPSQFTVRTIMRRLSQLRRDPWDGFAATSQTLPAPPDPRTAATSPAVRTKGPSRIVHARAPARRP
jgi:bifunctional non-homologous end joining protein LigD